MLEIIIIIPPSPFFYFQGLKTLFSILQLWANKLFFFNNLIKQLDCLFRIIPNIVFGLIKHILDIYFGFVFRYLLRIRVHILFVIIFIVHFFIYYNYRIKLTQIYIFYTQVIILLQIGQILCYSNQMIMHP